MEEENPIKSAAQLLRAIPSEARSEQSKKNGKNGGRPKGIPMTEATKQKLRDAAARRKAAKQDNHS